MPIDIYESPSRSFEREPFSMFRSSELYEIKTFRSVMEMSEMTCDAESLFPAITTFRLSLGCAFLAILCAIQHLQPWLRTCRYPRRKSTDFLHEVGEEGAHEVDRKYGFCSSSECVRCRKPSIVLVDARAKLVRCPNSFDEDLVSKIADAVHADIGRQQRQRIGRIFEYPGSRH